MEKCYIQLKKIQNIFLNFRWLDITSINFENLKIKIFTLYKT